ncbi:MAG: deoxyribose-phosphate aldolase, partial [Chloroflexota bacterium]
YATQEAINAGAREIDMAIHIGALKSRDLVGVFEDISDVALICHDHPDEVICKVIIETALLTDDEKIIACQLAKQAGADFVVTGTRYDADVLVDNVRLMREVVGDGMGVKAVGDIRTLEQATELRNAGANRLGTTHGVIIAQEIASQG